MFIVNDRSICVYIDWLAVYRHLQDDSKSEKTTPKTQRLNA